MVPPCRSLSVWMKTTMEAFLWRRSGGSWCSGPKTKGFLKGIILNSKVPFPLWCSGTCNPVAYTCHDCHYLGFSGLANRRSQKNNPFVTRSYSDCLSAWVSRSWRSWVRCGDGFFCHCWVFPCFPDCFNGIIIWEYMMLILIFNVF